MGERELGYGGFSLCSKPVSHLQGAVVVVVVVGGGQGSVMT